MLNRDPVVSSVHLGEEHAPRNMSMATYGSFCQQMDSHAPAKLVTWAGEGLQPAADRGRYGKSRET